jgi:hypothetical protein
MVSRSRLSLLNAHTAQSLLIEYGSVVYNPLRCSVRPESVRLRCHYDGGRPEEHRTFVKGRDLQ